MKDWVAIVLAFAGICTPSLTSAQEPLWGGQLVHKIDSLAAATLVGGRISGFSIGVMRGQDVLHAQGYGVADLDHGVPAGPHTVYQIASITKQFTAAAILQLVERGRIALDDPITEFFPEYPSHGHLVTVRHLLTHTSGVRSYPSDDTPLEPLALDITDEELLNIIQAEPFDFVPGESFRYSNAGYVLLGMIVERASNQTYGEYLENHVFGSLGMGRSAVCDRKRVAPGRARGYGLEDGELRPIDHTVSTTHMGGAGRLCSTVFDLLTWQSALSRGGVVSSESYDAMVTPATLVDGSAVPYGFGLNVRPRLEGNLTIYHGGGATGFSTRIDYYPESDLTIVVMSNTYGTHAGLITDAIGRWALGIPMPALLDEQRSTDEMDAYVGRYNVSTPEQVWRVHHDGTHLFLTVGERPSRRLKSQGDHIFAPDFGSFSRITFGMEGGRAIGFNLHECQVMNQERCRTREGKREP